MRSMILDILCSMMTRVQFCFISCNRSTTSPISWSLSPAKGSSSSSNFGLSETAMPISSMRLSPYESSEVLAPALSCKPTLSRAPRQFSRMVLLRAGPKKNCLRPLPRSAKRPVDSTRFSQTVMESKTETSWKVLAMPMPTRSCGGNAVISSPPNSILPTLGGRWPVSMLNRVDLPDPFGPMMPLAWPSTNLRLI